MNRVKKLFRATALRIFFPKIHNGTVSITTATVTNVSIFNREGTSPD